MFVRAPQRGLSLLELVLVMGMTMLLFGITHLILTRTIDTWWRVNSKHDSEQQLYRAQQSLERDLRAAAFELQPDRATIEIAKAPGIPANDLSGADGDVLWFLSAIDPMTGEFRRHPDGTPFWQRNIVYYLVTPKNLAQHFDYQATGFDVGGYEVACPFKLLVRMEIDSGVPTSPTDPSSAEKLMDFGEVSSYLDKRPDGYDCAGMAPIGCSIKPVAANLLSFRVELNSSLQGVSLDLRATSIDRARREGGIASRDLSQQPVTTQLQFLVLPPNRPPTSTP